MQKPGIPVLSGTARSHRSPFANDVRPWVVPIGVGVGVAIAFVVAVGIITDAIDVPFLARKTPLLAVDYPIFALNAALLGSLAALSVWARQRGFRTGGGPLFGGGFLAAFAISCPACNVLLIAAFGSSGVAAFIEPVRPYLGAAATAFLAFLLVRRVRTVRRGCINCAVEAPVFG